jgi:predicted ABC-type ATPase
MSDPTLLVIAGCNGSGKSSYSKLLAPPGFQPFDYDIQFLKSYRSLLDIDIREEMAHNLASAELERQIDQSIAEKNNFCYETNFNSTPLHWPELFKNKGYKLQLIYLCLKSIDDAIERVAIRVQNGGHNVSDSEIKSRYFAGFSNLDSHFDFFDIIDIFDTSAYSSVPRHVLSIEEGVTTLKAEFPQYLNKLIPTIAARNH